MTNRDIYSNIASLGLDPSDFEVEIKSNEELINTISNSARLFYSVTKHIVLNEIRSFLNNQNITLNSELSPFFPRKERVKLWNNFRESINLKVPGLQLNSTAKALIIIHVLLTLTVIVIGTYLRLFDPLVLYLSNDIYLYPVISGFLLIPIGITAMYGSTKLPAGNFDDLTNKIVEINTVNLLSNSKSGLKELISSQINLR
jgi:hypothetical protein